MKRKRIFLILVFILMISFCKAQKVDSIYFHLYTDSLKKGTHNYINVDGKLSNGRWLPLTDKEILFSTNYGTFEGNELILPEVCNEEKVIVKAVLKSNPAKWKEVIIWIKKKNDTEILPTKDEILNNKNKQSKNKPR